MLMHHTDAQANGISWSCNMRRLAIDEYLATIGMNQAIQDIHQGRFACTVFADQRVDFAFMYGEIDRIVGYHSWPGFGNVAHFDCERRSLFSRRFDNCTLLHRLYPPLF